MLRGTQNYTTYSNASTLPDSHHVSTHVIVLWYPRTKDPASNMTLSNGTV